MCVVGMVAVASSLTSAPVEPISEAVVCSYTKPGCTTMTLGNGSHKTATRSLKPFQNIIVSDIVKVIDYVVIPGGQPSVTFEAKESLLDVLVADVVSGTLTLGSGCSCQQWFRQHRDLDVGEVTAKIVNAEWPHEVQFRDSSSATLDHASMSSLSCGDSAGVEIDTLSAASEGTLNVNCKDSAGLEVGTLTASRAATLAAADSCDLSITRLDVSSLTSTASDSAYSKVATGTATKSTVTVSDSASMDLGTLAVDVTQVTTTGSASFTGQVARTGDLSALDSSSMETTLNKSGTALCKSSAALSVDGVAAVVQHAHDDCSISVR